MKQIKSHLNLNTSALPQLNVSYTPREDTVTLPCVGLLLTVSFLSLPLLSPSLAAGISLTFAIGLTRSLVGTEGGMDCIREVLLKISCYGVESERSATFMAS